MRRHSNLQHQFKALSVPTQHIVCSPVIAKQHQHTPKEEYLVVPPVKTNRVNIALSVVQSSTNKRQTTIQKMIEVARIMTEKKRERVAAEKICKEREDKERGDYQRYFYMLGKHDVKHKQYERHLDCNMQRARPKQHPL